MDGRSAFADRRRAAIAAACIAIAATACTATSPPPLPPRRVDFRAPAAASSQPGTAETVVTWPADLPAAAEAPSRDERYYGWTLTADALSLVPLVVWTQHPKDFYLAAPALLLVPAIHLAHGEQRNAGISLAMRTAMVGLVYLAGRLAERECRSSSDFVCLPIGSLVLLDVSVVQPIVIDSIWLARRRRPAPEWDRLPLVGAVVDADGRRLLTLSARF